MHISPKASLGEIKFSSAVHLLFVMGLKMAQFAKSFGTTSQAVC